MIPLKIVVALLTPPGRGAVATLTVEGPGAAEAVSQFLQTPNSVPFGAYALGRIAFGRWGDARGEEIVACQLAKDRVELHCHGGRVAWEQIAADLKSCGCRRVDWRELAASRANDAVSAEALVALAQARTERTAAILLDQCHGALSSEVAAIRGLLGNVPGSSPAPQVAQHRLQQLLRAARLGVRLVEPFRVVLAGRPNVGKSSLINAMVGYERAIVFDQPGTTRDVVTAATAIDGWPVEMADTAGLRAAAEPLEAEGVARSRRAMQSADCLILVFDLSQPWTSADSQLLADWPQAIVVHNKADLTPPGDRRTAGSPARAGHWPEGEALRPPGCWTSATMGMGIEGLLAAIAQRLVPGAPPPGAPVPFTRRQVDVLNAAAKALAVNNFPEAQEMLERFEPAS
jgi:tRNA modification GTPase